MSRIEWTDLLVKMFALFQAVGFAMGIPVFLTAISTVAYLAANLESPVPAGILLGLFTSIVLIPLLIALILWRNSRRIAHRLWRAPPLKEPPTTDTVTFEQLQITAFSTIGLYFLVSAIPGLLNSLAALVQYAASVPEVLRPDLFELPRIAGLLGQLIQIGIASVLLFGPGSFASTIRRFWQPRPAA